MRIVLLLSTAKIGKIRTVLDESGLTSQSFSSACMFAEYETEMGLKVCGAEFANRLD